MLVARMLFPVVALGPGNRIGIWVCGCNKKCFRCANPELQKFDNTRSISVDTIVNAVNSIYKNHDIDGITISGGEPFEQIGELADLVTKLSKLNKDILIFTGYTLTELIKRNDDKINQILNHISVLIDGEYIDERNTGSTLRGSDNQKIHYLKEEVKSEYEQYISCGRLYQNFSTSEGVISVGLHHKGFLDEIKVKLAENQTCLKDCKD